ncbi:MAG: ribosomal protein S18-alanine N-acetyltransferase [Cytophagales bacterium]|nr:ribosomal protein S18-alanine N-acetyltransferase [Armatimonadota bacterium]
MNPFSETAVIAIRPMLNLDIEAVSKIEKQSFTTFWSTQAYVTELTNPNALYLVATLEDRLVGYGGLWVIMDEAHITTIAVEAGLRGKKIGERLLAEMLLAAQKRGASRSTLEVRETNDPAKRLYEKYGFEWVAIRKAYYSDNNENADILWINDMTTSEWRRRFAANRAALGLPPS